MIDRQDLANQLLDYLQTAPTPPEYLAEPPETLTAFDPYQMVGEWIALRQEVKQQNKSIQSAHATLEQTLEVERSRNEQLQAQIAQQKMNITTTKNNDEEGFSWRDLLSLMDDLDRVIAHNQSQLATILTPPPLHTQRHKPSIWDKLFPHRTLDRTQAEIAAVSLTAALTSNQEGIEMIRRSLLAILRQQKITPIVSLGEPFDSQCMYAIAQQPNDSAPVNSVVQEVVRGYRQGDRILREAQVIVASRSID